MTTRISEVSIEGFRGINSPLKLVLSSGLNILTGDNYTGKTSVLQAIEWCVVGKLPSFSTPDFKKEDALVNMFHPKKAARVEIVLGDGKNQSTVIERSRSIAKSTTVGKNPIKVSVGKATYEGDDAGKMLAQSIGIEHEEFARLCCLHQEDIRRILSEDPEERSRSIDSLLGTVVLRELIEGMDVKRKITSELKALEAQRDDLKKIDIGAVNQKRTQLNEQKKLLVSKGYLEEQFSQEHFREELTGIYGQLEKQAKRFSTNFKVTMQELAAMPPYRGLDQVYEMMTEVERQGSLAKKQCLAAKSELDGLQIKLNYYHAQLDQQKGKSLIELRQELSELEGQTTKIGAEREKLVSSRRSLVTPGRRLSQSESMINDLERKIEESEAEGKEEDLRNEIVSLGKNRKEVEENILKFSDLAKMQEIAMSYLQYNPTDRCPVCDQRINAQSLLGSLASKGQKETTQKINELRSKERDLEKTIRSKEQKLEEITRLSNAVASEKDNLRKAFDEIEHICGKSIRSANELEVMLKAMDDKESALSADLDGKERAKSKLTSAVDGLKSVLDELESAEKATRTKLGTSAKGRDLLKDLEGEIQKLAQEARDCDDTSALDALRTKVGSMREIAEYFRGKEELGTMEKQLTTSTTLVKDIQNKIAQLTDLEGSVLAIQEILMQRLKNRATVTISKLEKLMNKYYSALIGQTYFTKLSFETDPKKPLVYNAKAISPDQAHQTYLTTRFSTAQMNIAALAMFLSLNESIASSFSTLVMDDPSQSMDREHKKALARLLTGLSNEKQIIIATQDTELVDEFKTSSPKNLAMFNFTGWKTNGPEVTTQATEKKPAKRLF